MVRAIAVLGLSCSACFCRAPWVAWPRTTVPDDQYTTGSATYGYDVYVWECHGADTQRTVVFQYSAEMTCQSAQRETAPCGTPTATEASSLSTVPHLPARDGRAWRP